MECTFPGVEARCPALERRGQQRAELRGMGRLPRGQLKAKKRALARSVYNICDPATKLYMVKGNGDGTVITFL